MLIDLDHVPIAVAISRGEDLPRPRPHTFLTPLALALAGRRSVAFGVLAHLARDLFNGPGVDALWPLRSDRVRLPVAAEAVALGALLVRAARRSR